MWISRVKAACEAVGHEKEDQSNVMLSLTEEVGELAQEVKIVQGLRVGPHGKDGVVGEAVDVILCALDIIHTQGVDITQLDEIVERKCAKWVTKAKR